MGYKYAKAKNLTKAERGHCRKAGVPDLQHLVEFKVNDPEKISEYEVGTQLPVEDVFKVDDLLDLAGTSIGKGFQGSIKRWGHSRGPMTHGARLKQNHTSFALQPWSCAARRGVPSLSAACGQRAPAPRRRGSLALCHGGTVQVTATVLTPRRPPCRLQIAPAARLHR